MIVLHNPTSAIPVALCCGISSHAYSLSYDLFVVPLVKAMQEQQQLIQKQDKKIAVLQKELNEIKELLKK